MSTGSDDTLRAPPGAPVRAPDLPTLGAIDPANYTIDRELARGGMGRILVARDRRLGRPVAIKELLATDADARGRFEREARITARLQHPAIVNVIEAGAWPSGEPCFVMKLVAGESLDKVIARHATLAARIALVPDVIAVTRALAYAHGQRVIHRDLKPANVLVGEFGEIVVVDWGLAKDLDAPPAALAPAPRGAAVRPPGGSVDETVAGAVMGTPAYMPAEQAAGNPVDERADVYALGAMLYHVLAGAPPYVGKTTEDILVSVLTGPPPPLEQRTPGVPRDLVAIVGKAMAHEAKDRYPTARELAEDLEKFQTGQLVGAHRYSTWQLVRRWVHQHRASVAVGAIAFVVLVVVGIAAIVQITSARRRAEAQRAQAEDLVEFMMVDLRDKLAPLGRIALLDGMAQRARTYYRSRGGEGEDVARRATAIMNIGELLRAEGDLVGALAEYRVAAALRERATPSGAARGELAITYDRIGDVLLAQRDAPGAVAMYRKSLALAETPHDLAVSHDKLGDVLVAGADLAGALVEFEAALAIRSASPPDAQRQRDLGVIYERIGNVYLERKDHAAALARFTLGHAIAMSLATTEPSDANRRDLAISYDRIGDVLVDRDDLVGALANYRESLALRAALAAKDPDNVDWQRQHSLALDDIADVMLAQHQ
ncbi:MAG: serine/threonine-protein kinase, partial [Proteobacteria bacterium]|nr:serine/threonine-protein kinase [Pseudomonadota bacterium]